MPDCRDSTNSRKDSTKKTDKNMKSSGQKSKNKTPKLGNATRRLDKITLSRKPELKLSSKIDVLFAGLVIENHI
jgi:hypothetical protein